MTLRMLDSVIPGNLFARFNAGEAVLRAEVDEAVALAVASLDPSADAYLGYTDGMFTTFPVLRARFAGLAHLLDMAVFSSDDATGSDSEPGDMNTAQQVAWVRRQLARGVWRPVCYRSISGMPELIGALGAAGISRGQVRLLSAHYGAGKHICGGMDGTQWTDLAPGAGGSKVDESALLDDFFGGSPDPVIPTPPIPAEDDLMELKTGTGQQTIIKFEGGTARGVSFGCDAGYLKANAPWLRVAAYSHGSDNWDVQRVRVPDTDDTDGSGQNSVDFKAADTTILAIVRDSNGPADDVPVGVSLY